ncbi:gp16 family protein [Neisseria montereyensis]|uniref:Regulatory protein GemA n=1 Tax=Neisseria montereyensis TaxID=2973938 RepID=A0ABT2FDP6_9NEIS|nr:regulatory protein GemA [Neisseria montereyensis]MCS4534262.1 regulatory protein GemA [Neisseria montereyensis]
MKTSRNAMIAKIKIAQKELNMADDAYRAMLMRITGKNSCTKMTEGELDKVIAEMQRMGFRPQVNQYGKRPNCRSDADPMMRKIAALLAEGNLPWNYAHAMAKRMFGVDRVQWLSHGNMHKLVAALQIAANRKKKEA